jgi:hypothetical protein
MYFVVPRFPHRHGCRRGAILFFFERGPQFPITHLTGRTHDTLGSVLAAETVVQYSLSHNTSNGPFTGGLYTGGGKANAIETPYIGNMHLQSCVDPHHPCVCVCETYIGKPTSL